MFKVYVLKDSNGRFYKGLTSNLEQRLQDHRRGATKTTRKMKHLEIIYTEECATLDKARMREKYLKSAAGRRFLKKKLNTHA